MKRVKVQLSTKKELKRSVKKNTNRINKSLSTKDKMRIRQVELDFDSGKDSKAKYSKNGRYLSSRIKIHNLIIKKILSKDKSTKNPDIYIFGGVGGSGKGSLKHFIKETTLTVNNDDIKMALAKYNPSGSKYKLLHAGYLHREAKDIEEKVVEKLLRLKKDIILDRTISNFKSNYNLLKKFQSRGYKIHTLGTNLKPHIAITRATTRFLKGDEGRYVPLNELARKGNSLNKNAVRMARSKINSSSLIVNTKSKSPSVLYSKNFSKEAIRTGKKKIKTGFSKKKIKKKKYSLTKKRTKKRSNKSSISFNFSKIFG